MESAIYYLILFAIIFVVKTFKVIKQKKTDSKVHFYEVLNVSLEIVYTASGLVIALILNVNRSWIPAVFAGYVVILIISAFLEVMQEYFKDFQKGLFNALIIVFMVAATVYSYSQIIPKVDISGNINPEKIQPTPKNYTIIIPYMDHTLAKHIGYNKMIGKTFFYEYNINALRPDSLAIIALEQIRQDTLVKPIIQQKVYHESDIEFLTDKIKIFETSDLQKFYWR